MPPNHYGEFQDMCQNFWYAIAAIINLQLDPAGVDQEWLEYSDLSPLARVFWVKKVFTLFVASLAAFHLLWIPKDQPSSKISIEKEKKGSTLVEQIFRTRA
jgi:hypothetical protein